MKITVNTDDVFALAARVERVDGRALNAALIKAVNATVDSSDPKLRAGMVRGINLPRSYVDARMEVERATTTPHAEIVAWGPDRPNRAGLTILGRYDPVVTTRAAKHAKGDPSRGVPAGRRADGVSVRVTGRKTITGAFTMKLKQGASSGTKIGVFIRRSGKARHLYGVSPYSLFRFQESAQYEAISDELELRAGDEIDSMLRQIL